MKRIVTALLLIALISCGNKPSQVPEKSERQALAVEVMEVQKGKLIPFLERSGTVRGENEVSILSQTQGEIIRLNVKLGDSVKEGDVILQVDDNLARLNFKAAEEQWKTARLDYEALSNAVNQGGSSRRDLSAASNRLASAELALASAREQWEHCRILSPITGNISELDRSLTPGNRIQAGQPVARIVDESSWRSNVFLGEKQIGLIREGQEVEIRVPSAGDEWNKGNIEAMAAGSDVSTGSYRVQVQWDSENPEIKSGMTAEIRLPTLSQTDYIIIPSYALIKREGKDFVYLEDQGMARAVEVEKGDHLGVPMEIRSGLREGDRLIISGMNRLSPGYPVNPSQVQAGEALK